MLLVAKSLIIVEAVCAIKFVRLETTYEAVLYSAVYLTYLHYLCIGLIEILSVTCRLSLRVPETTCMFQPCRDYLQCLHYKAKSFTLVSDESCCCYPSDTVDGVQPVHQRSCTVLLKAAHYVQRAQESRFK